MRKKQGKKFTFLGCLALMLAISAASLISFSYSKYTKSVNNGAESATVADFGVTLTHTGMLFSEIYATDDESVSGTITNSVVSGTTGAKKLAPGTNNGTGLVFTAEILNNEVAVQLSFNFIATNVSGWVLADGTAYEPVHFVITQNDGETTKYYNGTNFDITEPEGGLTISQVGTINTASNFATNSSATYIYTICWFWDITSTSAVDSFYECKTAIGDYSVGDVISQNTYMVLRTNEQACFRSCGTSNDALDTYYSGTTPKPNLTISASVSATQID